MHDSRSVNLIWEVGMLCIQLNRKRLLSVNRRTSFFSNQNKLETNDDENFSINENVVDLFIVIPQWSQQQRSLVIYL